MEYLIYRRKNIVEKYVSFIVSNIICCSCHDNEKSFLSHGLYMHINILTFRSFELWML